MGEEEAAVRREFDSRRAKLKDDELLETTSLRIKHATEVERLQHRICTAALGVRGEEQASGSSRGCSKKKNSFSNRVHHHHHHHHHHRLCIPVVPCLFNLHVCVSARARARICVNVHTHERYVW